MKENRFMHTNLILFFSLMVMFSSRLLAQTFPPDIQWQKSVGGSSADEIPKVRQTFDGGYIAMGFSWSNDGNVTNHHGEGDYWLVKFDSIGNMEWQKAYGGSRSDYGYDVQQLKDSSYILIGETQSTDGDVVGNHGGLDCWVVKINKAGGIEWTRTLGGSQEDRGRSILQTNDGGFVLAASTSSNDGDVTGFHGVHSHDFWIVKLTFLGGIQWTNTLGGTDQDEPSEIILTNDGGYMVSGYSDSHDGDVTKTRGLHDVWIVKLDSAGQKMWQKSYGGSDYDGAGNIDQTADNGYIISGYTSSNDGQVRGHHGQGDFWVLKIDSLGVLQWQKALGGSGYDSGGEIQQTFDGGFVVVGFTESNDGDIFIHKDSVDVCVFKLSPSGSIVWQKTLGGSGWEYAYSIKQTADSGYIIGAFSTSKDGDVTGNHGRDDYWIVKLLKDPVVIINNWLGNVNTTWEDPLNWSLGVVPTPEMIVEIKAGTIVLSTLVVIRDIVLRKTSHLIVKDGGGIVLQH